jgi:hypothetical protein
VIQEDKRWIGLAYAIKDRNFSPIDFSNPASCLNGIKEFCVKIDEQCLSYFPNAKTKLINNLKTSLDVIDFDAKLLNCRYGGQSLEEQLISNLKVKNFDAIVPIIEKMRIFRNPNATDHIKKHLSYALEHAIPKVPILLKCLAINQCSPEVEHLFKSIKKSPQYVPLIINAMKKYKPSVFKTFRTTWFISFINSCPQHIPLFLEGLKLGHRVPTLEMVYLANEHCPTYLPQIIDELQASGYQPDSNLLQALNKFHSQQNYYNNNFS